MMNLACEKKAKKFYHTLIIYYDIVTKVISIANNVSNL